jgi:hypothetical protein
LPGGHFKNIKHLSSRISTYRALNCNILFLNSYIL